MVHELLEVVQIVPPFEQEGVGDEAEPGRDQDFVAFGLLQQLLQLLFAHVTVALDLVGIRIHLHVLLHEEDVVDLMFAPNSVGLSFVVNSGEIRHFFWRDLCHGDAQLSLQSPLRGSSHSDGVRLLQFRGRVQGVTAAGVCEAAWKSDFGVRPLL